MLYRICLPLQRWIIRQFFRSIRLAGAAPQFRGPVLFVCNHPNFALDSLVVQTALDRDLWFLAKGTLFKNKLLAKLLTACHVIPVYRRQDNPDEMTKNLETFRLAASRLQNQDAIVIFPEGVSKGERQLSPLKSGAARIAFQAEVEKDFSLNLVIQPIGLTYTDLKRFRSSVTVTFGPPIVVSELKDAYHRDAMATVDVLTDKIEQQLRHVTVEVSDLEFQSLVEKIGKLYRSKDATRDDKERLEIIAREVARLGPSQPEKAEELEQRIDFLFDFAGVFSLEADDPIDRRWKAQEYLYGGLILPFVICGTILLFLPYQLVRIIVNKLSHKPVDRASFKLGVGLLLFPVWLMILTIVVFVLSSTITALLFLLFAFGSAVLTNRYLSQVRIFLLSRLWPGSKKPVDILRLMRDSLILELERLRGL